MWDASRRPRGVHLETSMMKRAVAVLLLVLAGCRTLPPPAPAAPTPSLSGLDWSARRALLQGRESFGLSGRVAVAAGSEGFNGHLRWSQQGTTSLLDLEGPLGVGGVHVRSDGTQFDLTNAAGQRLDSDAARAELTNRLGFDLPLAHLRYWVQGVPDPALPATETQQGERLSGLAQDGWNITYTAYQDPDGLPQKLSLVRGDARVRLVIDAWHL